MGQGGPSIVERRAHEIEIRIFSSTRSAPPVMTGEVPATLRVASARPHGAGAQPVSSEG